MKNTIVWVFIKFLDAEIEGAPFKVEYGKLGGAARDNGSQREPRRLRISKRRS